MRIEELLLKWHDQRRPYVCDGSRHLSYKECCKSVTSNALEMRHWGVQGSNCALISAKGLEYIVGYWSAIAAKATVVPLNNSSTKTELVQHIKACDCAWLIVDVDRLDAAQSITAECGVGLIRIDTDCMAHRVKSPTASVRRLNRANAAIILKTSGSAEATSRYVALSHKNLISNAAAHAGSFALHGTDVVLIALPLHYSFTNTAQLICHTWLGGQLILYDAGLFFPKRFCQYVEKYGVTITSLIPPLLRALDNFSHLKLYDLTALRYLTFGGAPSSMNVVESLTKKLPTVRLAHTYGLTEASPRVTTMLGDGDNLNLRSIGKPIPGVYVRILTRRNRIARCGEIGELQIRGPNIMLGYYRADMATESVLQDGWLRTGDLAMCDEKGHLFLLGRSKNVIVCGGINICPEEIEVELSNHPHIRQVVVRPESDACFGEIPVAHVELQDNTAISLRDMHCFLTGRLAPSLWPRRLVIHRNLARTSTGKLKRIASNSEATA